MRLIPRPPPLESFRDALGDIHGGLFHLQRQAGLLFCWQFWRGREDFHGQGVGFLPDFHFFEAVDARAAAATVVFAALFLALLHVLAAAVIGGAGRAVFDI